MEVISLQMIKGSFWGSVICICVLSALQLPESRGWLKASFFFWISPSAIFIAIEAVCTRMRCIQTLSSSAALLPLLSLTLLTIQLPACSANPFPPKSNDTLLGGPSISELYNIQNIVTEFQLLHRNSSGVECSCTILRQLSGNRSVVFPDDEDLEARNIYLKEADNNFNVAARLRPRCVVIPQVAGDVARAVAVLKRCGGAFAVRGGGHMPPVGFSNIQDGVLIALSALRTIQLQSTNPPTVDLGPGLRWKHVYDALLPHGLFVVGGRVSDVGVAGLILGGGISYYSTKYGFAMDNVEEYEVVLADARIVIATPHNEHKDLFWALKGGSSNFGIVTRFRVLAHPAGKKAWIGQALYSNAITNPETGERANLNKFLNNLQNYIEAEDTESGMLGLVMHVPSAGGDVGNYALTSSSVPENATLGSGYNVVEVNGTAPPILTPDLSLVPEIFKPFVIDLPALPGAGIWNITPPNFLADLMSSQTPRDMRNSWRVNSAVATRESAGIISEVFYSRIPHLRSLFESKGCPDCLAQASVTLQLITSKMIKYGQGRYGGNTFGLDAGKRYYWYILVTTWVGEEFDNHVNSWGEETLGLMDKELEKRGLLADFVYLNDASKEQEGDGGLVFARFPEKELKRLKRVRDRYDPKRLWKKGLVGGYKIPE